MSTESVAQRLLSDARKKTARQGSPFLARFALAVSILSVLTVPFLVRGYPVVWVVGGAAVILGGIAVQRTVAKRMAWTACTLGFLAICAGTFLFTLYTTLIYG